MTAFFVCSVLTSLLLPFLKPNNNNLYLFVKAKITQ